MFFADPNMINMWKILNASDITYIWLTKVIWYFVLNFDFVFKLTASQSRLFKYPTFLKNGGSPWPHFQRYGVLICFTIIFGTILSIIFGIILRYDLAQLGERVPPSLFNDIIKLLEVRVLVIANCYDPTTL